MAPKSSHPIKSGDNHDIQIQSGWGTMLTLLRENDTTETGSPRTPRDLASQQTDSLRDCVLYIAKHHGRAISPTAMLAGVPLDKEGRLTPSQVEEAARNAGLESSIRKSPLDKLPSEALPAVLFLEEHEACVLLEIKGDDYMVAFPSNDSTADFSKQTLSLHELEKQHNGFVLYLLPHKASLATGTNAAPKAPYHWLWKALSKNWWAYVQVLIAAMVLNIMAVASPLFVRNVYDRVLPNSATDTLWVLALGVAIVFVFDLLLRTIRAHFIDITGKKIDVDLEATIFNQLLAMRLRDKPSSVGGFASILREIEVLRDFFTSATLTSFVDLPFVVIFIALFYYIGGPMAFTFMAALPVVCLIGLTIHFPMKYSVKSALAMGYGKQSVMVETLSNIETVKSLGCDAFVRKRWNQHIIESAKHSVRSRSLSHLALNLTAFVQQCTYVIVIIVGAYLIKSGELTTGGLVACSMLSGRVMGPFAQIAQLITRLHYTTSAYRELDRVMNLPRERSDTSEILSRPVLKGRIQFNDATFTYPNAQLPALNNVTMHIEPGERVGVIGKTGSGKSTLGKLLLSLYTPDKGAVLVDGTDLRQVDPFDLRRWIGYVSQDVALFQGSVRENICIANSQASDEEVLKAALTSGVNDFIRTHPQGYALPVGERGENLSGGQRQSIGIARALLRNPNILVMDEPTSSLDTASETLLMQRLHKYIDGKTLVLITHRPTLLALVDRIIVLDEGSIVADGPKEAVLRQLQKGEVLTAHGKMKEKAVMK